MNTNQKEEITQKAQQTRLILKERQLDLIMAIDYVRDTLPEPSAMLAAIANILSEKLQADLCLLCLLERETGDIELKAVNDRGELFGQLESAATRELAKQVVKTDDVTIWTLPDLPDAAQGWFLAQKEQQENKASAQSDQVRPPGPQLATVPIIMGTDERLGALLLARSQTPFGPDDVELLKVAESQIDSAVMQGYAYHDLQQRNKELETIYRIDRLRDRHLPFDEMLNSVLQELRAVIQAEMGFIMLYNQAKHRLELRAATHDDLFRVSSHYEVVDRVANEALQQAEMVCHNNMGDVLRSMLCIPLILRDEIIGVLGVVNRYGPGGFRGKDQRLLSAIGSQIDTAIFESLEQRRLRQVLGRSVDPRVMERLLANPDVDFLKGERMVLSVLYADIRGSTILAERTDPELLVGFINDYLGRMTEVVLSHEGTLDKFVGDEVIALFGAPFPQSDHALRAVRVGLEMQVAHQVVMETWREHNMEPAPIGIGIATGEMTVGEMGCPQRTDYTIIGRGANLGSRICSAAEGGQVLISQATYDLVEDKVEAVPIRGLQLKGVGQNVTAYHVIRTLE